MSKIILSDTSIKSVEGAVKKKPIYSEKYKKLVDEATMHIEKTRVEKVKTYQKAKTFICR